MTKNKGNPLQAALNAVSKPGTGDQDNSAIAAAPKLSKARKPRTAKKKAASQGRAGTVLIGGHFPPTVKQQLRIIAAEDDTTSQALLEEALNLLFVKKGKKAIL